MADHTGAPGNVETTSGYAINANAEPERVDTLYVHSNKGDHETENKR